MAYNSYSILLEAASSQYLTAADSASLSVILNLTIELGVKFTTLPSAGNSMSFVAKYPGVNNRSYHFYISNAGGVYTLYGAISDGAGDGTGWTTKGVTWTSPVVTTWYHLTFVYTAAGGTGDFYVNGAAQGSQQAGYPTSIFDGNAVVEIGSCSGGTSNLFDGKIDDVRIWAAARTAAQIDNYRRVEIPVQTGLNAYWKLNNSLLDETTNDNDLTNHGAAVFSTDVPAWGQVTDTAGAPTESGSYSGGVKAAFVVSETDTAGAPTEDVDVDYGWSNTSKSTAPTWVNLSKS
jgi:hypothetical protein